MVASGLPERFFEFHFQIVDQLCWAIFGGHVPAHACRVMRDFLLFLWLVLLA
jgi:hypothetical protein